MYDAPLKERRNAETFSLPTSMCEIHELSRISPMARKAPRHLERSKRQTQHRDTEAERLIEFASMWAPYGGVPEEEVLVRFGMTTHQFIERLWQFIPESNCDQEEIRNLASAYPPSRRTSSATRPAIPSAAFTVEARWRP